VTGRPTRFLAEACGFVSTATYADEDDETVVHHAELLWPEGGGVMLGTAGRPESEFSQMPTGCEGNVWSFGTHRGQPIPRRWRR
jgi:hypothetical protein